ncbi:MAG: metallophosphoesterase [Treponema sp.]|nr:metallophosphoesterase [Treponema sp.]
MTGENWKCISHFEKNKFGRDFVCGDIHGCFDDLEAELKKIKFNKTFDRLFCTGDLIDRGPRSEMATYYMRRHWFFSVLGNHECMFLMANSDTPKRDVFKDGHLKNGGAWAYEMEAEKANEMLTAIDDLPLIIRVGDVLIAHAAVPAVPNLEEIENNSDKYIDTILTYRQAPPTLYIPEINTVYVGHTILEKPTKYGKYIYIDTGLVRRYYNKEGYLTIIELENERINKNG